VPPIESGVTRLQTGPKAAQPQTLPAVSILGEHFFQEGADPKYLCTDPGVLKGWKKWVCCLS